MKRPALVAACVLAITVTASCTERGDEWDPSVGTLLIREHLGRNDTIDLYVRESPDERSAQQLIQVVEDAGLPVRDVEQREPRSGDPGSIRIRTALGDHTGFWSRRVPGDIVEQLSGAAPGAVVLSTPPFARVSGGVRVLSDGVTGRDLELTGGDVRYRVPEHVLLISLGALLVFTVVPIVAMRIYARFVVGTTSDPADKVHRLRRAVNVVALAAPVPIACAFLFGLPLLPEALLSEWAPSLTQNDTAMSALGIAVVASTIIATTLGPLLVVTPNIRRLRGVEKNTREAARRAARAVPVLLLPAALWIGIRLLTSDADGVVRLALPVVFLITMAAFGPLLLRLALPNHRLEGAWRERLLGMCHQHGLRIRDIRVLETRREKTANAAFAGVFPGPRYLFVTDYLMDHFADDEIEAVIAHEIGHGKRHHIPIKLGAHLLGVFVLAALLSVLFVLDVFERLDAVLFVPVVMLLLLAGIVLIHGGIGVWLEKQADDYAAATVGAEPLAGALRKLAELNTMKRNTGRLWNLLQQHPGIDKRLERLEGRTYASSVQDART